jgi:TRAP-type C4-dicarboxylate transport system permease small subunit
MTHSGLVKPNNYLVAAIFVTLCCCVPFGIVSIVFAAQVDSKWSAGDHAGAAHSAHQAKTWFYIALLTGLIPMLLYGLAIVVSIASGGFEN